MKIFVTAFWITGKSGSGKTTLAYKIADQVSGVVIDGEVVREETNNFDYSLKGRKQNLKDITKKALSVEKNGIIPIIACISPDKAVRKEMQKKFNLCVEIQLKGGSMWYDTEYEL